MTVRESANTPEVAGHPDYLINPDLSAVHGVDRRFWIVDGTTVRAMTTAELDARVPQWQAEHQAALLRAVMQYGARHYPPEQLAALRDEYLRAKTDGRPAAVAYLQPVLDFEAAILSDYRARRDAIATATTAAGVWAVSLDFAAHDAAAPLPKRSVADAQQMGVV